MKTKNFYNVLILSFLLITGITGFAQKSTSVNQVIIGNGGKFEVPPYTDYVTLEAYNPTNHNTNFFGTVYTQSIQDLIISGNFAYVAAQDSIVMYNIDTYQRVAAVADSGLDRLQIYNNKLIVTKQYPVKKFFVEILDASNLALWARIQNVSGECAGIAISNDSVYIAVNYGYLGTHGKLAVINPNNWQLVHEVELGDTAMAITDLYAYGGYIFGINENLTGSGYQGGISKYNIYSGSHSVHAIPYYLGKGIGIKDNILYMIMNFAIGSYNLDNGTVVNPSVVPDPGSFKHIFYTSGTLDYVNDEFYLNFGNQSTFGYGIVTTLTGDSLTSYQTGINADAIAIDFRSPSGINPESGKDLTLSTYPNPVNNILSLKWNSSMNALDIRISDLTGRIVLNKPVSSSENMTKIDISSLPSGIYFITVQFDNGVQTRKIVKK
ncbi:MAG: T9SS type A sorting domain-containing protein [Bacteroidota bacterium]|nr:T9SS type A sorting domain-containing protein [Bacteroidota bacterium]